MAAPGPGGLGAAFGVEVLQLHAALAEAARLLHGVGGEAVVIPHQEDPDLEAHQKEKPGRADAVPAVVPRAAEHRRPALLRLIRQGVQSRLGHRRRRPLHQVDGGNFPLFYGPSVQFPHLRRRRQLHVSVPPACRYLID